MSWCTSVSVMERWESPELRTLLVSVRRLCLCPGGSTSRLLGAGAKCGKEEFVLFAAGSLISSTALSHILFFHPLFPRADKSHRAQVQMLLAAASRSGRDTRELQDMFMVTPSWKQL